MEDADMIIKTIPLLDAVPSENYDPLPDVAWFKDKDGNKVLAQLWQAISLEVNDNLPNQVWVIVHEYKNPRQ
jgi:hypothetical protein